MRSRDDANFKPVLVFTNKAGRFFAEGLAPGRYNMILGANLDIIVPLEVPDESKGTIDVGTIVAGTKGS